MIRNISICDISVKRSGEYAGSPLPFRVKIEVAKLLSRLGVSVVETSPILDGKSDYFLVKSLASAVSCTVSVPVDLMDPDSPARVWEALSEAARPRLQVPAPVSTVQMEYFCHRKPAALLEMISQRVAACAALGCEVEFVAEDFGRAENEFLASAIKAATAAGATVVTVADAAGNLLPDEFQSAIEKVKALLPEGVKLGVYCSNDLHLADACAVAAVRAGADEIKTMAFGNSTVSLKRFPRIINAKSEVIGASCPIQLTTLESVISQISKLCDVTRSKSPTAVGIPTDVQSQITLNASDDMGAVLKAAAKLGYELGEEDSRKVFEAFQRAAKGNAVVGAKEIDAIVASEAFQVPSTYNLESFVINTGNTITPTCQVRITKGGETLDAVSVGDGPVDASIMAVEKLVGRHYELDDFQVKSVTEGTEAMGETVVRLRHEGRVYSGRGVSKDIVGSSLMAYLSAINKIAYEEEQA